MVPIDPEKVDDMFYRYKMPAVITKVEGSGNGIKTVIPNIHDICLAINRPEEVLMKFFQFEIGAQRNVSAKDDKFLLMGSHTSERMQDKIYDFVRKFVLCKHCRNPETAVQLDSGSKSHTLSIVCSACGKRSMMDDHRVLTVMRTYYEKHPKEATTGKGTAMARKKGSDGTDETEETKKKHAQTEAASPEKATKAVIRSDLQDDRQDPSKLFADCIKENWGNNEELINRAVRKMSEYNLPEHYGPTMIISAFCILNKNELLSSIKTHAQLMKRMCTVPELYARAEGYDEKEMSELLAREAKIQITLIRESAKLFMQDNSSEKFAVFIFLLFVEGALRDSSIVSWMRDVKKRKNTSEEREMMENELREKVAPIVAWLSCDKIQPAEAAAEEAK